MNFVLCYTRSWECDRYLYVGVIRNDFVGEAHRLKKTSAQNFSTLTIELLY